MKLLWNHHSSFVCPIELKSYENDTSIFPKTKATFFTGMFNFFLRM